MALLLFVILCAAASAPWHTPWSVDERTTLEMIHGVAHHGLPYTINGPVERFSELQARWNFHENGRLWGAYPPAFAYIAAPFYRIGGALAVVRLNIAFLAPLVMGVFLLGRRLGCDPVRACLAAWLVVLATPVVTQTMLISRYPLVTVLMVWSVLMAASTERGGRPTSSVAAGLLAGVACATHLIALPLLFALIAGIVFSGRRGRKVEILSHVGAYAAGAALAMCPVIWLNVVRFGTPSPFANPPCVWKACSGPMYQPAGIWISAEAAIPLSVWILAVLVCLWLVRSKISAQCLVASGAVVVLLIVPSLRDAAWLVLRTGAGLLVDPAFIDLESAPRSYSAAAEGPGVLYGSFVVKAVLQGSPMLALAGAAWLVERENRLVFWLTACAAVTTIAGVILRGITQVGPHVLGFPFLSMRYAVPAMPFLVLLAVVGTERLPWKTRHLVAGSIVAVVTGLWLASGHHDHQLARRLLLLRGSVVLAAAAVGAVAAARLRPAGRWPPAAAATGAAAIALSVAINGGVDTVSVARILSEKDDVAGRVEALTPRRFAIIGHSRQIDPLVGLIEDHDLQYADLYELRQEASLGALVDHWMEEARPVFLMLPPEMRTIPRPLRGLDPVPVDREIGLIHLVSRGPG